MATASRANSAKVSEICANSQGSNRQTSLLMWKMSALLNDSDGDGSDDHGWCWLMLDATAS